MNPFQRTILLLVLTTVCIWGFAASALAQAPPECALPAPGAGNVQNPTRVCFEVSPDHDMLDSYALDLIDPLGTTQQTIDMGLPTPVLTGDGTRWVSWPNLNVMPRSFGAGWKSVVRSIAMGAIGPDSLDSNFWDRVPGPPGGRPRVVGG